MGSLADAAAGTGPSGIRNGFARVIDRYLFSHTFRPARTALEPLLILHDWAAYKGIKETALKRRILYWRHPSIDSSFYALDILNKLGSPQPTARCAPTLFQFLRDSFVAAETQQHEQPKLSAFRQSPKAAPTVYAGHMAINLIKLLEGISVYRDPLGYANAVDIFRRARLDIEEFLAFATRCLDQETGGFYDFPQSPFPQLASIQNTHSACYLFWNLDRLDSVAEHILRFVFSCLTRGPNKQGFSEYPGGPPLTCSTYYALRVLQRLGQAKWIQQNKTELIEFFDSCWDERGGFKASPSSGRTLIHTCLAVAALLDILEEPSLILTADRLERLTAYVRSCEDRHGGFQFWSSAIGLGGRWYAANLYATYHAVCLGRLLEEHTSRYDPTLDMQPIIVHPNRVEAFVESSQLGTPNECIARGYPKPLSKVGRATAALFERLGDTFLMPRNPLKYPLITMTPIPYYELVAGFLAFLILALLGHRYYLSLPQTLLLLAGPTAMQVGASWGIMRWFATR